MLQKNRGDVASTTPLNTQTTQVAWASLSERPIIHFLIIKSYEHSWTRGKALKKEKKKTNEKIGTVYPPTYGVVFGVKKAM